MQNTLQETLLMKQIDLTACDWFLAGRPLAEPLRITVPTDSYAALHAAGVIPDPYRGTNEKLVQWVAGEDWTFTTEFDADQELRNCSSLYLNIDYIDTFGEIFLNDRLLGRSDNMFCRFRVEMNEFLRLGKNELKIVIASPLRKMAKKMEQYPEIRHNPNNSVPGLNLIRKTQCHGGWDWGICLLTSGIYGKIFIQGVSHARLEHVETEQAHNPDGSCDLTVSAQLFGTAKTEVEFRFNGECSKVTGMGRCSAVFRVEHPKRWQPSGYGQPHLYPLEVSTQDERICRKIGLRTVELVNEPGETGGLSMVFRVNGSDIFCKGANWIPADAMPSRCTRETYRRLLAAARAANMNMIRVWGGGLYEFDDFYELCDELGLLVWQDFMFACADYPADREFLESVRTEVDYQVRRLRDHACIALWCGDNEITCILGEKVGAARDSALIRYDRLNRTVAEAVAAADPGRIFWPSSPCNSPNEIGGSWHDVDCGDSHYWDVWHGGKPFTACRDIRPRFCSEFGFQSFPSRNTVQCFMDGEPWNLSAPAMEVHQKNGDGNTKIIAMLMRYFRFPSRFDDFLYLSQVQQALAVKTAVEYWRTQKPYCMGTLYWQFNDNWPVTSWSGIDYYGEWKQLQYHAARFYAPVIITAFRSDAGTSELYAVSDLEHVFNGTARVTFFAFDGQKQKEYEFKIRLAPQESRKIAELPEEDATSGFYFLELYNEEYRHSNEYFLTEYKNCELPQAEIASHFHQDGDALLLELSTNTPAFYVVCELTSVKATWSDNSLLLLPGRPVVLQCHPDRALPPGEATSQLRITQLGDLWQPS